MTCRSRRARQLRVREQPLLIASARAVEADAQRRAHEQAHEIRARRRVHVQQRIESPPAERSAHVARSRASPRVLSSTMNSTPSRPVHQRVLGLADDPSEPRARPRVLDRAHDGHRVARVADGREANDAERRGRLAERQLHAGIASWEPFRPRPRERHGTRSAESGSSRPEPPTSFSAPRSIARSAARRGDSPHGRRSSNCRRRAVCPRSSPIAACQVRSPDRAGSA